MRCLSFEADEAEAKRVAGLLEGMVADESALAIVETGSGRWAIELYVADGDGVSRKLAGMLGRELAEKFSLATVAEKDWVAASLAGLEPVRAGRFVVHGAHNRAAVGANQIGIEIEAALAFGTGHHGTTRGCLAAIERIAKVRRPRRILDVGTGTGVLAIAAARAFRRPVVAGDFDPVAVTTARANMRANRAGSFVRVARASGVNAPLIRAGAPYDLVLANILLPVLQRLAAPLRLLLAPGATVVLSGLLPAHGNAALAAFRAQALVLARRETIEGWTTLTLKRGAHHCR
jgi:ribosomal protein L11 methyltransferase